MSAPAPVLCPFLGLADDPHSIYSAASDEHCCYATSKVQHVSLSHQEQFCLTSAHPRCPLYKRAKLQPLEPKRVVFEPSTFELNAAVEPEEAELAPGGPKLPAPLLDRVVKIVTVMTVLFAMAYFAWFFLNRSAAPAERVSAALLQTRTATATSPPTRTNTPRPTPTPTPTPVSRPTPPAPAGGLLFSLNPPLDGAGWVASSERTGNHFGDGLIRAGVYDNVVYYGVLQFDLAAIPSGTKVVYAVLELVGAREDKLTGKGSWQTKIVSRPSGKSWASLTFDDVQRLQWDYIIPPTLSRDELGKGKLNRFELTGGALSALERQFGRGQVTFRLEGSTGDNNNLFAWDSGIGTGSQGFKPVLHVGTEELPPTPTATPAPFVVIPCVPTPASITQREALAATATEQANLVGTATAYPPHYVTPVLVTPTATPASVFTAAAIAARATFQATTVGTATPLPPNWVFPLIVTNTPRPENQATAIYQAAYATAAALTTGTPTPLPCFVWTATPLPPTPVVVYYSPATAVPTREPTATPTAIPEMLRGKIGFISDREGTAAVYVMEPDGSNVGKLTNHWAYDTAMLQQTLTADGSYRLAVLGNLSLGIKIVVFWPGSTQPKLLVENSGISYDPAFAPDGYNFAFVSTVSGPDEIYRLNRDGTGFMKLTTSTWEWNKRPTWSPDAQHIAWWSNRETGRKQIWIMNANGSNPHQGDFARNLSNNVFNDWDPVWFR